ncbi:hypothetical protein NQ156_06830 [Microbacterium sp. zg.Y625]|uniref:hypothetical protein n=1 Tax=Microbacterium jiangjiandongii TaxID=3049071 RepID=UPI00214B656E|nr:MULTISPECIES: hypothetical protein [unclassified Microbacterium]MCR2792776.1 hypothetical protein [Microbacterium sp. zg.Y625]WIM26752.1 hypothetical protein QNO14_06855 [Microbacterium sp. zg-Y625]
MTDAPSEWDPNSIVVVPGLPNSLSRPDGDDAVYPGSTLAFVKVLRGDGYPVRVATPDKIREVSHHSAELWLPLAEFGLAVLAGGAGNVLADILMRLMPPPRRSTTAHIRWKVQGKDGVAHDFSFDGDGDAAIEAARAFERSLGYGEGDD